jgi:hypothetical protein
VHRRDTSTLFAQLPPMPDRSAAVLAHLVASSSGHTTQVGIPNLQQRLRNHRTGKDASRRSIQMALRDLESLGVIRMAKRGRGGINQYQICVPAPLRGASTRAPGGASSCAPGGASTCAGGRTTAHLGAHLDAPIPKEHLKETPVAALAHGGQASPEGVVNFYSLAAHVSRQGHRSLEEALAARVQA